MTENSSPPRDRFLFRRNKGQAAIEFALAFPILLMIMFGIIDFSMLFGSWLAVENVARQAVRVAATGQYDTADCQDLNNDGVACTGANKVAEVDAARLTFIHRAADNAVWTMMDIDPSASNGEKGHFDVVVCSARDDDGDGVGDRSIIPSQMGPADPSVGSADLDHYAQCLLNGIDSEDAGAPYTQVIVMVDFDHPYLTPFLNFTWQNGYHLASSRQAIVEAFRVSRVISVPPPIVVASLTPLPTNTPTITFTPTITNTPTITPTKTLTSTITQTSTKTLTSTTTLTRTPTAPLTSTMTPTITFTPTKTLTPTITFTPSKTFTPTITSTVTVTRTPTLTRTITLTPTKTLTPTITLTPTKTFTRTITPTFTLTYTRTVTRTPTNTNTVTLTPTKSATPTITLTPIPTTSKTPTITPTPTQRCFDC